MKKIKIDWTKEYLDFETFDKATFEWLIYFQETAKKYFGLELEFPQAAHIWREWSYDVSAHWLERSNKHDIIQAIKWFADGHPEFESREEKYR